MIKPSHVAGHRARFWRSYHVFCRTFKPLLWGLSAFALMLGFQPMSGAIELAIDLERGLAGTNHEIAVQFDTGTNDVAGIQFDIYFDAGRFSLQDVEAGAIVAAAGKELQFNLFEPGKLRIFVAGFNNIAIASGELVVVTFAAAPSAPDGFSPMTVESPDISSTTGLSLDADVLDGGVFLGEGVLVDVNVDGSVDAVDVQLVINALLGLPTRCICDANGDGVLEAADLQTVINGVLGVGKAMLVKITR